MRTEEMIYKTIDMYLTAYECLEKKIPDYVMETSDMLYQNLCDIKYKHTNFVEQFVYGMAMGITDYYFIQSLRKYKKVFKGM